MAENCRRISGPCHALAMPPVPFGNRTALGSPEGFWNVEIFAAGAPRLTKLGKLVATAGIKYPSVPSAPGHEPRGCDCGLRVRALAGGIKTSIVLGDEVIELLPEASIALAVI